MVKTIKSQLLITANKISDTRFPNVDKTWPGRGWLNPANGDFVLNIPKCASNTVGIVLQEHNKWQPVNFLRNPEVVDKIQKYHVILRDPETRWVACMAEHLSHRVEYGEPLDKIIQFVYDMEWYNQRYMDNDMHMYSQASYCHGVPVADLDNEDSLQLTNFYRMEDGLDQLFDDLGITYQGQHLNSRDVHQANGRHVLRDAVEDIYNPGVEAFVKVMYNSDYELLNLAFPNA